MNWYIKVLKNYANFNGRASRSEFWYFFLFHVIILVVLGTVGNMMPALSFLSLIYSVGTLLPNIAVWIRRMHDTNHSGWYCLIPIYSLILAATEGDRRTNDYGADPWGNNDPLGAPAEWPAAK